MMKANAKKYNVQEGKIRSQAVKIVNANPESIQKKSELKRKRKRKTKEVQKKLEERELNDYI